jgi:DNA-binding MarR family transcriptional regulator
MLFYGCALHSAGMGFFFGVLHLAYGAYLYLTEKRKECGVNPEPFLQLDRVIHEKGRLAIMSMLAASPELSFTELRDALGMTDGNLTTHIRALQQEGYVSVAKSYQNNRPLTTCSLTAPGRKAFAEYINLLEQIVRQNKPK